MKHKRIELPSLPYAYNALSPVISEEIMLLHHSRHHLAYVTGANAAMDKVEKARAGEGFEIDYKATLRDLSFHLNGHKLHSIFWTNMRASKENNLPTGDIATKLTEQFGSFDAFKLEFAGAAKSVEGSGWAALVESEGDFHILQIQNHNLLSLVDSKVLLVLDVWEHTYYLDYKNDRGMFVDKWWNLVNWDNVNSRLA
ncbi:MAG: superoxide dismutase [bacterium]